MMRAEGTILDGQDQYQRGEVICELPSTCAANDIVRSGFKTGLRDKPNAGTNEVVTPESATYRTLTQRFHVTDQYYPALEFYCETTKI